MMSSKMRALLVLLVLIAVAGCPSPRMMSTESQPSSQQGAAKAVLDYCKLASE